MRQAEEQAKRLAQLDAIARAERQAKEADAKRAAQDSSRQRALDEAERTGAAETSVQRSELVRRIQAELRDRQCYNGELNGEISDGEAAIKALNAALEQDGRQIRKVEIRTSSRARIEAWLQWLLEDLGAFRCARKQAQLLSGTAAQRPLATAPRDAT
jgi:hypothetical protein